MADKKSNTKQSEKKDSNKNKSSSNAKQEKSQQPNAQTGLIVGGAIVLLVVVAALLGTGPDQPKTSNGDTAPDQIGAQTCQDVCQSASNGDYSGATSDSCVEITKCESPNRPLVDNTGVCNNAIEACCCQPA